MTLHVNTSIQWPEILQYHTSLAEHNLPFLSVCVHVSLSVHVFWCVGLSTVTHTSSRLNQEGTIDFSRTNGQMVKAWIKEPYYLFPTSFYLLLATTAALLILLTSSTMTKQHLSKRGRATPLGLGQLETILNWDPCFLWPQWTSASAFTSDVKYQFYAAQLRQ